MRLTFLQPLLLFLFIPITSCNDDTRKKAQKEQLDEDDFFENPEVAVGLHTFKNELEDDHTDFLRSFSQDEIQWLKWDPSLLEKAKSAQSPIMALVGSAEGGDSRNLGRTLSETPKLRETVTRKSICTVVDTLVHPEMATLCYHLTSELKRMTAFPTLVWFSHEGSPLAWIPIGKMSGRELEIVVTNSVAMVEDIWNEYSQYAVENSRFDNDARQIRFNPAVVDLEKEQEKRDEIFRSTTRQLSSLYSSEDRDLDNIGGVIPTNSLELLALGMQSNLLTKEVRDRCQKAVSEVALALTQEAIKDHLSGSYFSARRTTDWSLPSFSKTISSQARIAHMLFRVGSILENQTLIAEGDSLLSVIKSDWLSKSISSKSPANEPNEPGKFFWDLKTLKKVLSEDELPLALAAFSIKKDGNIPSAVDPLENYYELNTLRRRTSLKELTQQQQKPARDVEKSLALISQKLLNHREEITKYDVESTLSASDLALILRAQLATAGISGNRQDLQTAQTLAERLLHDYHDPEKGLARLPLGRSFITARCGDYAATSGALILLYQATLDEKWLTASLQILDEAMTKLATENGLLSEIPKKDRVIPLRQHHLTMIFGESSLGSLDLCLNRAWAITGDTKYSDLLKKQSQTLSPMSKKSPVNHTDYITSCALGEHPLLAIMKGDPKKPAGQKLLAILNSQKHLPFLSIRAARDRDMKLQDPKGKMGSSITLIRNGKTLGSATTEPALKQLLNQIISGS